MPAPKGNKNALGHAGAGGNPGAGHLYKFFSLLKEMYLGEQDRDELLKKIESGKYSVHEAMLAKALAGNKDAQIEIFKKFFPDSLVIDSYDHERSELLQVIDMTDEKYERFIEREFNRLGLNRSGKKGRARPAR